MLGPLKTVINRVLFLAALYSGVRLLFLLNNWSHYTAEDFSAVLFALVHGVRFDVSVILTLNLPFILLWLTPLPLFGRRAWQVGEHCAFVALNAVFLILNITDIELINFNARRMTWAYFNLRQDVSQQLPQIIAHYWMWSLACVATIPILIYFTPKRQGVSLARLTQKEKAGMALSYLLLIFGLVVGLRGGLQNKPVREAHAFRGSAMLGHLTLNTPFTVVHSRKKAYQKEFRFMADEEAKKTLKGGLRPAPQAISLIRPATAPNVVLIILESFALEYMGKINGREGYTPFLDELAEKSLFFTQHYANARRSIEAIPAILASLPSLLHEPFLLSSYQGAQLRGLPQVLSANGYRTAFFHGAENGSMFFDSFAKRIGFDKYYGMSEYPHPKRDWDGFWGILDGPFLQFFADELSRERQPFFAAVFTLSSHQPYPIPSELKGKFPRGTLEIHESIGYTDYALREFFQRVENEPWFDNTLFVITADHTQKSDDARFRDGLGPYRTPLLFYKKNAPWAGVKSNRITQHTDIPASILDYVGLQGQNIIPLGQSVFNGHDGFFVAREADSYIFHERHCTLRMTIDGEWADVPAQCGDETKNFFKAYVQYFTNGVLKNALF